VAQLGLQRQLVGLALAQRVVVDGVAVAALLLAVVHREVGVAQHVLAAGVVLAVGQHDAETQRGEELAAFDDHRRAERVDDAAGDPVAALVADRPGQQQRELVAAQAGQEVVRAQAGADALADFDQQRVAGGVAQRVVDQLEAIHVDQHQRERATLVERVLLPQLQDALAEVRTVGQRGQRVVQAFVLEPRVGLVQRTRALLHAYLELAVDLVQRLRRLQAGDRPADMAGDELDRFLLAQAETPALGVRTDRDHAEQPLLVKQGHAQPAAQRRPVLPCLRRAAAQHRPAAVQHLLEQGALGGSGLLRNAFAAVGKGQVPVVSHVERDGQRIEFDQPAQGAAHAGEHRRQRQQAVGERIDLTQRLHQLFVAPPLGQFGVQPRGVAVELYADPAQLAQQLQAPAQLPELAAQVAGESA